MQTPEEKEYIKSVSDVFNGLTDTDIVDLYSLSKIRKINAGEVFIKEGDTDQTVYIILSGSVAIEKNLNGKPVEIASLKKSACVGEIAFVKNARRIATATATEPSTIMAIDKDVLNVIPHSIKKILLDNLGELAEWRERDLETKIIDMSKENPYFNSYLTYKKGANSDTDVFNELNEKDIKIIFNLGKICELNTGDVLIKEKESDRTAYIILSGSVKIERNVSNNPVEITVLKKYKCAGEITFVKESERRTATVTAIEPSVVLALTEECVDALPASIRSVFLRNFCKLATKNILELYEKGL